MMTDGINTEGFAIAAFLTARLDEDEPIAEEAGLDYALREITAKREILAVWATLAAADDASPLIAAIIADRVLRPLAAVYAGHPDYSSDWAGKTTRCTCVWDCKHEWCGCDQHAQDVEKQ
jgi:hypothetical protein